MKKVYRSKMSFDVVAEPAKLQAATGIQIGKPCTDKAAKDKLLESFGIFGGSSDSNKFYSDIKGMDDVKPKPEDFVEVPFRLLSATMVGAGSWKASDFSDANLLKASTQKLSGKPVYKNHDLEVDNWVGMVKETKWTESFVNNDGIAVPAGIDGILAIDAKTSPKTARGVLMGAIYSNSVTVEFDWEPSHSFDKEIDFLMSLGSISEKDGKMVCRKVKAIHNYHESSLVFLGADPFAKLIDSKGNLKGIDVGSIEYSKANLSYDKETDVEKDAYTGSKTIRGAIGLDAGLLSYAKSVLSTQAEPENKPNPPKPEPEMKKLFAFIHAMLLANNKTFAFTAEQFTPENEEAILAEFTKIMDEHKKKEANLTKATAFDTVIGLPVMELAEDNKITETKVTLTGEGESLTLPEKMEEEFAFVKKSSLTSFADKVTALTKDAQLGQNFLKEQRDEAIRLYKLSAGTAVSEAVVNLMKTADVEALKGLLAQYGKKSLETFGGTCNKCNSTDISFRSSKPTEEEVKKDDEAFAPKSFEQIHKEHSLKPMRIGRTNQ